jgi:hypothetical protein
VKKIKGHGLVMKDRVANVKGKSEARGVMDRVAMKLEQGLGANGLRATVKSK